MTTKMKWRLPTRPTPEDLMQLTTVGIITKEEAREMLISFETEEDRDKQSLQDEIKFLRQLVQNLSSSPSAIYRTIERINTPYLSSPWYPAYSGWCSTAGTATAQGLSAVSAAGTNGSNAANTVYAYSGGAGGSGATLTALSTGTSAVSSTPAFSAIKTF